MLLTSRKHNPASFQVIINNHNISPEDNLKYLGVLLDNKLSWKPHVQRVKTQRVKTQCTKGKNVQRVKTQLSIACEFYPNLNIIQHYLYLKFSITH